SGRWYQRCGDDRWCGDSVPSISHTSVGSVSHSTGQTKNGAMARTDAAPATKAAIHPRHPRKPRKRSLSALIDTSAGMGSLTGERPQTWGAPARLVKFAGSGSV